MEISLGTKHWVSVYNKSITKGRAWNQRTEMERDKKQIYLIPNIAYCQYQENIYKMIKISQSLWKPLALAKSISYSESTQKCV
jgi:hypothetical protein